MHDADVPVAADARRARAPDALDGRLPAWTVRVDAAGNLRGVYPAHAAPTRRRLIIGSHLDTVPHAGAFDGVLGVVLGVALVELLGGRRLPFDDRGRRLLRRGRRPLRRAVHRQPRARRARSTTRCSTAATRDGVACREAIRGVRPRSRASDQARHGAPTARRLSRVPHRAGAGARRAAVSRSASSTPSPGRHAATSPSPGAANHAGTTPMARAAMRWPARRSGSSRSSAMAQPTARAGRDGRPLDVAPGAANVIPGDVPREPRRAARGRSTRATRGGRRSCADAAGTIAARRGLDGRVRAAPRSARRARWTPR